MRWTTSPRPGHASHVRRRQGRDLALAPSRYTPVLAPRLSRAPVEPPAAPFLAAALTALGAGALAVGGLRSAPVMAAALLGTAAMARVLVGRLRRVDVAEQPSGSLALGPTALHLVTDAADRASPLARLTWRRSSLRAGRVEQGLTRRSAWEVVLEHARGHELRVAVRSGEESQSMLAALGLDLASRSSSFPLVAPAARPAAPSGLWRWLAAGSAVLASVEVARAAGGKALVAPALVWALCAAQALLALACRRRDTVAVATPRLGVGVDGLALPAPQGFVPWTGLTRLRRSRHGLRITRPGHPPVAIDLQAYPAPPMPERRAAPTTPAEALRDSIAAAIGHHRRRPALPMPAPDEAGASDSYRQPARSLEPLWATLCDGDARPAERVAAAGQLAAVAPTLLREARRHLVEPTTTDAIDRLLSGSSIQG